MGSTYGLHTIDFQMAQSTSSTLYRASTVTSNPTCARINASTSFNSLEDWVAGSTHNLSQRRSGGKCSLGSPDSILQILDYFVQNRKMEGEDKFFLAETRSQVTVDPWAFTLQAWSCTWDLILPQNQRIRSGSDLYLHYRLDLEQRIWSWTRDQLLI